MSLLIFKRPLVILLVLTGFLLTGCYSFKGISIPANVSTFSVLKFENSAVNAPPVINQQFSELLRNKIITESRLKYDADNPHLEFSGAIQSFTVSSVAAKPNEQTQYNRLTITVNVQFVNHLDAKENWQQSFSFFSDFPSNQNFLSVQNELIETIFKQLTEDIFNRAFTNW